MRGSLVEHDLAYVCYALFGFGVLSAGIFCASYTQAELANGAGGLVLIALPLLFAAVAAALVGLAMSFRLAKHRPLVVLGWATAIVCASGYAGAWSASGYSIPIAYGASAVAAGVWWFASARARSAS